MRTHLDCYPCFLRQALAGARLAGADERKQRQILGLVLDALKSAPPSSTSAEIGGQVHRIVREETAVADPFRPAKSSSTQEALALYPWMEELLDDGNDRLDTALRLSIAGNIIDFAADAHCDLREEALRALREPSAIDHSEAFRAALDGAERVLYLADNAGETVFDRLLIETIEAPVVYAVKGHPVLNDATMDDAEAAGVDQVAALISNGSDAPGTILETCSEQFRRTYNQATLIIAKGQANYGTLSEEGPRVFFLLQTKCPVIARDVGMPIGSLIIYQGQGNGADRGHKKERQP